jgi:hypothetical protein
MPHAVAVIFVVDDGTFAQVHLTWRGTRNPSRGRPPSIAALRTAISNHQH